MGCARRILAALARRAYRRPVTEADVQKLLRFYTLGRSGGFDAGIEWALERILVGPEFRRLMPATLSLGACYLLVIDDLARTATSAEIPLGILTALVGAPVFTLLLRRGALGWA